MDVGRRHGRVVVQDRDQRAVGAAAAVAVVVQLPRALLVDEVLARSDGHRCGVVRARRLLQLGRADRPRSTGEPGERGEQHVDRVVVGFAEVSDVDAGDRRAVEPEVVGAAVAGQAGVGAARDHVDTAGAGQGRAALDVNADRASRIIAVSVGRGDIEREVFRRTGDRADAGQIHLALAGRVDEVDVADQLAGRPELEFGGLVQTRIEVTGAGRIISVVDGVIDPVVRMVVVGEFEICKLRRRRIEPGRRSRRVGAGEVEPHIVACIEVATVDAPAICVAVDVPG